ncbi:hypothetical protein CDAR_462861 [Caerostris darwini]|uniref:Uncharacterized protein n=1 Tax=Caerostris darwini TaxID=1538125 RepID=A0AAV4Q6S6_9ARAC|nr:hypothetical protein CDAR_462861 [Caerostris darwini]
MLTVGRPVYAILPPPENIFRDPITNCFEFTVLLGFMGIQQTGIKRNQITKLKEKNVFLFLDRKEQPIRGGRSHPIQLLGQFQAAHNIPMMLTTFFNGQSRSRGHLDGSQHSPITQNPPPMQRNKELVTIAHINIMGFFNLLTTTLRAGWIYSELDPY